MIFPDSFVHNIKNNKNSAITNKKINLNIIFINHQLNQLNLNLKR